MTDFFSQLTNLAVHVFAIASMAFIGFRYSAREILHPLRAFWGVILAPVANVIAVPLLALLILRLLSLETPHAIGLVFVTSAAKMPG